MDPWLSTRGYPKKWVSGVHVCGMGLRSISSEEMSVGGGIANSNGIDINKPETWNMMKISIILSRICP